MNAIAISDKQEHSGEILTPDEFELPMFDFSVIAMATDNFSSANKLGQGGFGSVYKVSTNYLCYLRNPIKFNLVDYINYNVCLFWM